jgi:hypothetical protein
MIRLLLLAYPAAWRRRYGPELEQLVDDSGMSAAGALDILRAGLVERRRSLTKTLTGDKNMLIGPAYRHPARLAVLALVVLSPTLGFVVGSLLAYQLGAQAFIGPMEAANAFLNRHRFLDLLLVISPAIALLLAVVPLVRLDFRVGDVGREAVLGLRLRVANVAVGFIALAIGGLLAWHIVFESALEIRA